MTSSSGIGSLGNQVGNFVGDASAATDSAGAAVLGMGTGLVDSLSGLISGAGSAFTTIGADLTNLAAQDPLNASGQPTQESSTNSVASVSFPFFEHPSSILGMLFGQQVQFAALAVRPRGGAPSRDRRGRATLVHPLCPGVVHLSDVHAFRHRPLRLVEIFLHRRRADAVDARDRHTLTARQGRAIHPDLPGADRRSPASHGRRRIGLAVLAILLGVPPVPNGTVARGLIWIPKESRVVALGSGRLARFLVEPGSQVTRGQALANLEEPFASGKRAKAQARLDEVDARLRGGGPFAL